MRLCIQEGCTEVLKYKKHFDIKDVAESELVQNLELLRKRLSIYAMDPETFAQDIALHKQKIEQLEEQIFKDDASQQTTGEHHATGGRLKILLGQHLQATQKEEQEHVAFQADLEAQMASLKAASALQEKLFARRTAANEALRDQLEAKVESFNGPAYRLNQLGAKEATANIQKITEDAFSTQWLEQTGIAPLITPEIIQTFIAKAMTVAQKAQTLGICISPPFPVSSTAAPTNAPSEAQAAVATGPGNSAATPAGSAPARPGPSTAATGQIPLAPQFVPGAFSPGAPLPADPQARAWETA